MTIDQVRVPIRGARTTPNGRPGHPPGHRPMCIVVNELTDGDGAVLVRNLRMRGSTRAILLARRAARRELVRLLAGGVRGAVAFDTGMIDVVPRPTRPAGLYAREDRAELSERELGVLALVAQGNTNRKVGEKLGLSALTVKSHLSRISRKLGTGDRAELVAIAIRTGLLP